MIIIYLMKKNYQVVGESKKKVYSLGDEVTIRVYSVDEILHTIDFRMV